MLINQDYLFARKISPEAEDLKRRLGVLYAATGVHFQISRAALKWSCFSGQVYGLAKMHLVCVHDAFRISTWAKYAVSGVRLLRAV